MEVKIIADGKPIGTRVIDTETGQDISKFTRFVSFEHHAGDCVQAEIGVMAVSGEILVKVFPNIQCQHCGRKFEFTSEDWYRTYLSTEDKI